MPWHDHAPWKRRRDGDHKEAIASIRRLLETFEAGGISWRRLRDAVDECLHEETARVVRVGNETHTPEVKS